MKGYAKLAVLLLAMLYIGGACVGPMGCMRGTYGKLDKCRQRFSIDTTGVFKIEKYGHWISRSPSCRVILDGVVLQEGHQP